MRIKLIAIIALLYLSLPAAGQTADTLSWQGLVTIIKKYHPVARRAELLQDLARARVRQARGGFDPQLGLSYDQKLYDGTTYYRFLTPELKLPLWYGIELKGNYAEAEGAFVNPENKLPKQGLSSVGVNLSLGRGLLLDRRRAALRLSRVFTQANENERAQMLNDLMLNAGDAYLNWQNQHRLISVYQNALDLAKVRFEAVKTGFKNGDRPAIDTVEALTQVQQRQIQVQQLTLNLRNSLYELASFLWLDNDEPVDPEKLHIRPRMGTIINPVLAANVDSHPKLLSYRFKLESLAIERRLKAENLRPKIDLQLGLLNSGSNAFRNLNSNYWQDNNKIGLQFGFPLTFTTARAELAEAKIKIWDTQMEEMQVRNELTVKLNQNIAELTSLNEQLSTLRQAVASHTQLLRGEEIKFKLGDSSLLLVNLRESKLLEVQEKLIETENKIQKNQLKGAWTTGLLAN